MLQPRKVPPSAAPLVPQVRSLRAAVGGLQSAAAHGAEVEGAALRARVAQLEAQLRARDKELEKAKAIMVGDWEATATLGLRLRTFKFSGLGNGVEDGAAKRYQQGAPMAARATMAPHYAQRLRPVFL